MNHVVRPHQPDLRRPHAPRGRATGLALLASGLLVAIAWGCSGSDTSGSSSSATGNTGASRSAGSSEPAWLDPYRELATKLVETALRDGQAYEKLSELCAEAPRRLSGSEDARRAVAWGQRVMERDGLANVRIEPVQVPHWERGAPESLRIVSPREIARSFPIAALGGSIATPDGGITARVVEVQSFEELEQLGIAARDRIVFFNRPMDPTRINTFSAYGGAANQRTQGAIQASKAGGVASINRSLTTLIDDYPHTGAMRYSDDAARVPAAAISTRGAEELSQLLERHPDLELRLEMHCRENPEALSHNVVGEIVGRELPDEIVVVGGHLDAWDLGAGAHDDGAGCVHSLEALRLLKLVGFEPRRTIRCVLFMNEENGVRGGNSYYAANLEDMDDHVFALESDRGGFTPQGFSTDANPAALETLQQIGTLLAPIRADRVFPGGGGVDIGPMRKSGVPLMGLVPDSQRYFDFHHSAADTIDAVNERELELGAAAVALMIAVVADMPERLPRNPIPEGR